MPCTYAAQVMMMLVPEAWQNDPLMPQEKKDFYMHTSALVGGGAQ
jgi:glutamate synthase domain-containing protein 1